VDDQLRNVRGAQQHGIATVHFNVQNPLQSFADALQWLLVSPITSARGVPIQPKIN
jgi:hypothetical protein